MSTVSCGVRTEENTKKLMDSNSEKVLEKWLSILLDNTSVDIVIPSYKFHPGVKSCIDSIRICTDIPYKIIVVNNGVDPQLDQYLDQQKDIHQIKQGRLNFAQAVNIGIRAGTGTHVCILNDDVIVSRGWLRELRNSCIKGVGAVGPLSNCDYGWAHSYSINIGGIELRPGMNTYQEIEPIISQIYDFKSPYNEEPQRDWVAFYCTLIPRIVIDSVGLLNEEFTNSGEDVDLCNRIRNCGYIIKQNYRSFVFHAGAVSRKLLEQEDSGSYYEADRLTNLHLKKLWGKKSVVLYSGPSWEKWNYKNVDTGGIGGSETWQVMLGRELSKLGYRVVSFCDCSESGEMDGDVTYYKYTDYNEYIDQHWIDYFITSRTTDTLRYPVRAGKIYVMIHDVWLLSDRYQIFPEKVTKYCVLSKWHWDFAKAYHGIPEDKMCITANGIDFNRYDAIEVERHPYRLFWSSSPDRGLDTLLYLFPFMKQQLPELELHIFYGFNNWRSAAELRGDKEALEKIDALTEAMKIPGVFYHGRVGQDELAREQKKSSLWAYSSDFEESFCCLPGTLVKTNERYKKIEEIQTGSKVMTHKGQYKPITVTMVRDINESIFSIRTKYMMYPLKLTGNHSVFCLKRESIKCTRLFHTVCRKKGKRCFKGHCYFNKAGKKYFSKSDCCNLGRNYESAWVTANQLKKGDFLSFPINKNKNQTKNFSIYSKDKLIKGYVFNPGTRTKKIKDFVITKDFLTLCGWYVSEGCFDQSSAISFSLNIKEELYANFICTQLSSLGLTYRIEKLVDMNTMKIVTHSAVLGRFFCDNFGHIASKKYAPQWVKDLDPEYLRFFLMGVVLGDGCVDRDNVVYECASQELIFDLFEMLLKFSCVSSLSETKKNKIKNFINSDRKHEIIREKEKMPAYRLMCSMNQYPELFKFMGLFNDNNIKSGHNYYIIDNDYVYFPIFEIKMKKYIGKVHNLEVKDDNSYIANGVSVHNCITSIEAQRSGVPVIATNYAGLQTTVGNSGILIGNGNKGQSYTQEYREKFVGECVSMLTDKEKWQIWSDRGFRNSENYSWEKCALRWKTLFEE